MTNGMWYLNVGTKGDESALAGNGRDDEEFIVARYEIIKDEFILTKGEEDSTIKGIADLVDVLYDRDKINLQTLDFRDDVHPYFYKGTLSMHSNFTQLFQADMVQIMIHEFGHSLTMNEANLDFSDTCPADQLHLETYGMCYNEDSYMNLYYQAFLKEYEEQWLKNGYETVEERTAFYEAHKDSFVTTYATVNLFEDIAESFSHFMLTPSNDSP